MAKKGVQKKKRTTGSNKAVKPNEPLVECTCIKRTNDKDKPLNYTPKDYDWKGIMELDRLPIGTQVGILKKTLDKFEGDQREKAAMSLLEESGGRNFKIASLIVIRQANYSISVGVIADKVLRRRSFEESVGILDRVGIALGEKEKGKIKELCEKDELDLSLYQVVV